MPITNRFAAILGPDGKHHHPLDALIAQGPIIPVRIEVFDALAQQLQKEGKAVPAPVSGVALIDTGASVSGVEESVIQALGVQPVGRVTVTGVTGQKQRSRYPAKFTFPGSNLPQLDFEQLVEAELASISSPGAPGPLIALIGRDILHHFVLIYNGPMGHFTLAC